AAGPEGVPASEGKVVGTPHAEVGQRGVETGEALTHRAALIDIGTARAHPLEEGADNGGLALDSSQRIAILCRNGQRSGKAFRGKVSHHSHEEGQVFLLCPLFEDGEYVAAVRGLQKE